MVGIAKDSGAFEAVGAIAGGRAGGGGVLSLMEPQINTYAVEVVLDIWEASAGNSQEDLGTGKFTDY